MINISIAFNAAAVACLPWMLRLLSAAPGSPFSAAYAPVLPLYAPTSAVSLHSPINKHRLYQSNHQIYCHNLKTIFF